MGVTAAELTRMQADAQAIACDKSCQIWRKSSVVDDIYGSQSDAYTLHSTTVAGMAQPSGGELQNYAYLIEAKDAWTVRLPIGTDVIATDHLVIEGQTLEVHILLTPKSYPTLKSVIAAELK
jgi:hypothetical protein